MPAYFLRWTHCISFLTQKVKLLCFEWTSQTSQMLDNYPNILVYSGTYTYDVITQFNKHISPNIVATTLPTWLSVERNYSVKHSIGCVSTGPVAINSTGSIVAIGEPSYNNNNGNSNEVGRVRIFEYDGSGWVQL